MSYLYMAIMKQSLKKDEISVVGGIEAKQNFTCQNKQFKVLELLKPLTTCPTKLVTSPRLRNPSL